MILDEFLHILAQDYDALMPKPIDEDAYQIEISWVDKTWLLRIASRLAAALIVVLNRLKILIGKRQRRIANGIFWLLFVAVVDKK